MSAHVLLNILNEFKKGIKCEVCQAFYLFFYRNEFNKFNKIGEQVFDSIYHMTFRLL